MRISIVGDDDYKKDVLMQLFRLAFKSETGAEHLMNAIKSDKTLVIFDPKNGSDHGKFGPFGGGTTRGGEEYETVGFDLSKANNSIPAGEGVANGELESNAQSFLGHELAHFNSPQEGYLLDENGYRTSQSADEVYAVEEENKMRKEMGMDLRTHHSGRNLFGKTISKSNKYPNHPAYNLVNKKKDYATANRGSTNRGAALRGSGFNIFSGIFGPYKRSGTYLSIRVKKPVPQRQTNITKTN